MGIVRGTNIVRDGLVFGYDTGYGIADPGVSTRFFKGKPTVNLQVNGVVAGHNSGNYGNVVTVADAPEKGPRWKKVTISNRGNNFRIAQWTYTTHESGVVYSHSAEFDWGNMRGKGYYMPFDGSGGGTRVHYINRNYTTNGGSNINANRQDGHFASTIVKSGATHVHAWFIYNNTTGVSGLNDYFYYRDYQVEKETEASPFISGTRSDTASLIDLKRNVDINLSNVSFDSTGQPTFDGTDTYITKFTDSIFQFADTDLTYEVVVNFESNPDSYQTLIGLADTNDYVPRINLSKFRSGIGDNGNVGNVYMQLIDQNGSGINVADPDLSGADLVAGGYYHYVGVLTKPAGSSTYYVYLYRNGELVEATNSGRTTYDTTQGVQGTIGLAIGTQFGNTTSVLDGQLPVAKVYNRALTAAEVQQNFNAYKNRFNI